MDNLTDWLKANRLSLNVDKSKLILFSSIYHKTVFNIPIRLQGIKPLPRDSVKYLGVYIDKHLSWDYHATELSNKISRANGILSKLRHYAPKGTLITVYYAILLTPIIWMPHMIHDLRLHQVYTCLMSATTFGLNSLKYKAAYEWNQFPGVPPQITNANSTTSMKRLLETHFLQEYKTM